MSCDEKDMRREISFAIRNIHGIRVGLFTPDMAFEAIVKKQIDQLKQPILKCIGLVVQELSSVVRLCTKKMSHYPRLREATELIIAKHIQARERLSREQILLLIDYQLAYINTNHEDFIGFANAQNKSENANKTGTSELDNQVIREGHINLGIRKGGSRPYWFVLTSGSISWFKEKDEQDKKCMLPLDGLKLRDIEQGLMSRRRAFALFNPEGRNVYKDYNQLELSCQNVDEVDLWKASFLLAGVYPEKESLAENDDDQSEQETSSLDPQLERQVETIRNLVDSYMQIVTKTTRDMVPKAIMMLIVNNVKDFINDELLTHLHATGDQAQMMEAVTDTLAKQEDMGKTYHICNEYLQFISDVSMGMITTPVPENPILSPANPGSPRKAAPDQQQGSLVSKNSVPPPPQIIFRSAPAGQNKPGCVAPPSPQGQPAGQALPAQIDANSSAYAEDDVNSTKELKNPHKSDLTLQSKNEALTSIVIRQESSLRKKSHEIADLKMRLEKMTSGMVMQTRMNYKLQEDLIGAVKPEDQQDSECKFKVIVRINV